MPVVPDGVLAAFGLRGEPTPLAGGMGDSVRVGDVVLKRADEYSEWLGGLLQRLRAEGVRTPRPIRAADGRYVVEGWTAAAYLEGRERTDRWAETMAAGRALHRALAGEPRPPSVDARTNRWAHADRVAWGKAEMDLGRLGKELTNRYSHLDLPAQLVHCDLSGNVLFHETEPPAVIDLSLYWRATPYAEAIVAVDAYLWYGAEASVLDLVDHPQATQLLLRATVFRLACELSPEHVGEPTAIEAYERLADLLAARCG